MMKKKIRQTDRRIKYGSVPESIFLESGCMLFCKSRSGFPMIQNFTVKLKYIYSEKPPTLQRIGSQEK
jgi:hypothetical protein